MFERKKRNLHVARPDAEIERGRPHRCYGCGKENCSCGESFDCYLCAKCRRILVDRDVSAQDGFSLLEGKLFDEMYGKNPVPGDLETYDF